jgi:hypothetical protein
MLNALSRKISAASKRKGFKPADLSNIDQKFLLVISELCEAQECLRDGKGLLEIWYHPITGSPEGFPFELTDALIRLLDIAGALKLDLDDHFKEKLLYNSRRKPLHGRKF